MQSRANQFIRKWVTPYLFYLPSVIIVGLGVFTMHMVSDFVEHHYQALQEVYQTYSPGGDISEVWILRADLYNDERALYIAVSLMALSACIMLLIIADQLRKKAKLALERKENQVIMERIMGAIDASVDGVAIIDENGNLTYVNGALLSMFQLPEEVRDVYLGANWKNIFDDVIDSANLSPVFRAIDEGKSCSKEVLSVNIGGEDISFSMFSTGLNDGSCICTVHDMTAERQVEMEKEGLQEQFYQSQKMEAIGRLAGGIAHDFNNILAAINGYAEFLVDDLEDDSAHHGFASNILQAGRRARSLVDQMLAFSRRKENSRMPMDLTLSLRDTLSMLQASLPKTIDVEENVEVPEAYINGNVSQMTQVLMNLCVNASDAIEDDHGTIALGIKHTWGKDFWMKKLLRDELPDPKESAPIVFKECDAMRTVLALGTMAKEHEYYCLSIEDTGCGMNRVIMEHIFEPFFTTKPVDKGTGLGLAMVHGAITEHRGCMIIDSTLGKGTRFDLYFPVCDSLMEEEVVEFERREDSIEGRMVLLVEDQPEVREMTLTMMSRIGVDAEGVESGQEALAVLRENPGVFDLMITDYNMPQMTGLELIKTVEQEFPNLPCILLSGYSKEKVAEVIQEQKNVYANLRKPVSKEVLASEIHAVLFERINAAA